MARHGDDAEQVNSEGEAADSTASPQGSKPADPAAGSGETLGAGHEPDGEVEADALAQAERILNDAGAAPENAAAQPKKDEAAELKNDLLRLQAEYVNYRKRVERDRAVAGEMAVIGVLNSLLPVLDDVDAARKHGDLEGGPFAAIAGKLENALKTYGLTSIAETGVAFDPTIHEALIQQPGEDVEVDTVSQVLRNGYRSGDRILRAAQVIVAVPQ
ncbi:nucleotide exchange factor GrpE [Paenarthrobacter sp. Z7-10]|uniref:nucleotide exchange factor GrpE n=1 Tax=Paenarthrobacter sp. Z7-10 TaxID=2787635 RepID=UPI0022A93D4E|nr:nucleotide exchange factor GrpE [Paenarthrobacter sp. Z7-10]MCZ2401856.1 nucleotide exchange factor GrpE [Paenarthrobacter sp. Z7-10]